VVEADEGRVPQPARYEDEDVRRGELAGRSGPDHRLEDSFRAYAVDDSLIWSLTV